MFWRKRQIADAVNADINSGLYTPIETPSAAAPKENDNRPCYQVGKTEDGKVTLRMGTDNNWTQLTMSNDGVDTLIRILEAAKEESVEFEISDESIVQE